MKTLVHLCALVTATLIATPAFSQDLILTAPPRESAADGQTLYGPLADYLSSLLHKKVVYVHPASWFEYEHDMRKDKYDLVFDGPHFISWRIAHLGNTVIVRLPGTYQAYLLAKKSDDKINSLDDMVGKQLCGLPSPNLTTVSILAAFTNPTRQPVLQGIRGGFTTVLKALMDGQCETAVIRNVDYNQLLTPAEQASLKIVYKSVEFPEQGPTVSKRLSEPERQQITQALTVGAGVNATLPIIHSVNKNVAHFIPAAQQDYLGFSQFLEGVIYGW